MDKENFTQRNLRNRPNPRFAIPALLAPSFQFSAALQEPLIRLQDAIFQCDPRPPSQGTQPTRIQKLSRRSIGFARIKLHLDLNPYDTRNYLHELVNRHILAVSNIDY